MKNLFGDPGQTEDALDRPPFSVVFFDPSLLFELLCEFFEPVWLLRYLLWPLTAIASLAYWHNWYEASGQISRIFLTLNFFQSLIISLLASNLISRIMLGTVMARHGIAPHIFGGVLLFGIMPRFYVPKAPIKGLPFAAQQSCYATPVLTKLAIFAIGMTCWAIMRRSGSGLSDVCLVLALTGLGSFLFTANPLWPADGYNWLAASLHRPKLRRHSLRLVGMMLSRRSLPQAMPRGEAFAMITFALTSIVFLTVTIFFILQGFAMALEEQLSGTGVLIFCLILAMIAFFVSALLSRRGGRKPPKGSKRAS